MRGGAVGPSFSCVHHAARYREIVDGARYGESGERGGAERRGWRIMWRMLRGREAGGVGAVLRLLFGGVVDCRVRVRVRVVVLLCVGGQRSAEGWSHEVWAGRIGTEKVFSGRSAPARSISAEVRVKASGKGGLGI